ncbi:hypothetical protein LC76P1_00219 [Lysinibacillus phage LC76P1]|nr:hypothetical protein LC76P1_00219 [Lysinibacillus phage LC76P1]
MKKLISNLTIIKREAQIANNKNLVVTVGFTYRKQEYKGSLVHTIETDKVVLMSMMKKGSSTPSVKSTVDKVQADVIELYSQLIKDGVEVEEQSTIEAVEEETMREYESLVKTNGQVIILSMPSCSSVRSARKWFTEHGIEYIERSVKHDPLTVTEAMQLLSMTENGVDDLIGTRSKAYQANKHLFEDERALTVKQVCRLITENPSLLTYPIVLKDGLMMSGFNAEDVRAFMPRHMKKAEKRAIYKADRVLNKFRGYEPSQEGLEAYGN